MTIPEICKEKKQKKHLTSSYISEQTDIPESTVNHFLSNKSKDPTIGTAGPICRVLHVSLDEYYDIHPEDYELETDPIIDQLKRQNEILVQQVRKRDRIIVILSISLALAIAYGIMLSILYFT